jgi:hypothetical protein
MWSSVGDVSAWLHAPEHTPAAVLGTDRRLTLAGKRAAREET